MLFRRCWGLLLRQCILQHLATGCEQFEASSQRTCLQKKDYGGALLDLHGETKQLGQQEGAI